MACSICGSEGHNARTCPQRENSISQVDSEYRDFAFWMKVDGITEDEAIAFEHNAIEAKKRIAPKGRGTMVAADKKDLPERIREAQGLKIENNDSKKRK